MVLFCRQYFTWELKEFFFFVFFQTLNHDKRIKVLFIYYYFFLNSKLAFNWFFFFLYSRSQIWVLFEHKFSYIHQLAPQTWRNGHWSVVKHLVLDDNYPSFYLCTHLIFKGKYLNQNITITLISFLARSHSTN